MLEGEPVNTSPSTSPSTASSGRLAPIEGSSQGNTPDSGFDCSGLVHYVYENVLDLRLPRTSRELARVQGPRIPERQLASGDLVFFGDGRDVSHVGIYVGEGRFVHAPSTGGTVRLDRLDGAYWRDHYSGARRVLDGHRDVPEP